MADKEPSNLKNITLRTDYKIENLSCCNEDFDIWENFKDNNDFKFCPFCGRALVRTINIQKNSIIGYEFLKEVKK